ncbi:KBTBD11 [Branchiostoma lanceolatum]|uniref:KBTBD11 protein n=1 Tax=Branchiostoma lanceolatum TaxID=7740 RepID=A0A8J9ZIU1_BRALA|nr:KBTBD11 [Branchiostoma lanceolatum]
MATLDPAEVNGVRQQGCINYSQTCDISICIDGENFPANKAVLGEKSDYFRAMFSSGMKESTEDVVNLQSIPPNVFKPLLDYMHTDILEIPQDCFLDMLDTVSFLQIVLPEKFIRANINGKNWHTILSTAQTYAITNVQDVIYGYLSDNLAEVMTEESFQRLSKEQKNYIWELRHKLRCSVVVLGAHEENASKTRPVYYYSEGEDKWVSFTSLPDRGSSVSCGVAVMDNYLYVVGGFVDFKCRDLQRKNFRYNPMTDTWTEIAPMLQGRADFGLVALDDHLYAIGGRQHYFSALPSVEKYNPVADEWVYITPLPKGSRRHAVTSCVGAIYISGGFPHYTDQMLSYSPAAEEWEFVTLLPTRRSDHGMVSARGVIYVMGGYRSEVDCFVISSGQWFHIRPTNKLEYLNKFATVCNDCIYFVCKKFTQCYDIEDDHWDELGLKRCPGGPTKNAVTLRLPSHVTQGSK